MRLRLYKQHGGNELWLEFGKINPDGWHDLFWYNEGRASEFGYWLKSLVKDLFTPNRYYLIRYGGIEFFVKGGKKTNLSTPLKEK